MGCTSYEAGYALDRYVLNVEVVAEADGAQRVHLSTDHPSEDLLLHWGVEGGKGYTAGWRLPAERCRPKGTVMYKDRALQTPWSTDPGTGAKTLVLRFDADEKCERLDFVIKDRATNQWFDLSGTNWSIPVDLGCEDAVEFAGPPPEPPQELCSVWAYLRWEAAGSPERSQEESQQEYTSSVQELRSLLAAGAYPAAHPPGVRAGLLFFGH